MKNKINYGILVCLIMAGLFVTGCEKQKDGCTDSNATNYDSDATDDDGSCVYCYGKGTLRLRNTSAGTTQDVIIDGISYGYLYPGGYNDYALAAGSHTFRQKGVAGGSGCSTASVIIIECQMEEFTCSN